MPKRTMLVSQGTCCKAAGAEQVYTALQKEAARWGLEGEFEIKQPGCHGFSQIDPAVIIEPDGILFAGVKEENAPEIIQSFLPGGSPPVHLFYTDPHSRKTIPYKDEIPFFNRQQRFILHNCGTVDPGSIEDYVKAGGYQALYKAVHEMTPLEVIAEIEDSGLRGLGGGGFSTGNKWKLCCQSLGDQKYLVCNADEGDPGSFQDRSLLEGDPHAVLEGMLIAGYAVGATKGYIYVRAEYPLAIKRLQVALEQAREQGLSGKNILGSDFSFEMEIFQGAGAFVCGEETALLQSLGGKRGMPYPRPPYPVVSGLHGQPTLINNVKTLAGIRWIINRGAGWFAALGTEKSKGTAVFSLSGKVVNCGLVEVPMGISLREIIFGIGGGIPGGKAFKAVQTGGPSGGCLPADLLDTGVDFDTLRDAGSIMGSGGMVVMDEDTCMVDTARYFLDFSLKELCGQCVTCRLGTRQMLEILNRIAGGKGRRSDLDLLLQLGEMVARGSLCGLGRTVPNPVLTTLRYFRDEYEAHIYEKRCPAGVCRELIAYRIDPQKCKACSLCLKACPTGAIRGGKKQAYLIEQDRCVRCGTCLDVCAGRFGAIECI
ncbi:MAG: NADH-ubiquinone oxidoreductase-F iron-sulfur binding region domain-containing protein [Bacillota bacterium]